MICRELIELLEKKYPPSIAESWDNPGLQVGSYEKEIKSIYIALDATGEVIRHAIDAKADLLLTHHPMLMHGLKKRHIREMKPKIWDKDHFSGLKEFTSEEVGE